MPKAKVSEFITYIKSKVGDAYLWGGQGESIYGLIRALAKKNGQSDEKTDKMITYLEEQGASDMEFFDCSGLGVNFLLEKGAVGYDMTADGFYRKCTKIDKSEVKEGDMGFLVNASGKATHIGYVVNRKTIVHALNQTRGVIEENINNRKWVFGRPDFCLEYDLEEKIDIANLKIGDKITIDKAVLGYNTAANAKVGVNPVSTYPSGTYYVFRVYSGTVNITRTKGTPGAWVTL